MKKVFCVLPFALILHSCSKKSDTPTQPVPRSTASTSATSSTSSVSSVSSTSSTSNTHVFIPDNYKGYMVVGNDSFPLIAAVCDITPRNAPYYRMVSYPCDTCVDFIELLINLEGLPANTYYPIIPYNYLDMCDTCNDIHNKARITCGFNGILYNSLLSGSVLFYHIGDSTSALITNAILMREYDMNTTIPMHGTLIGE